MDVVWSYRIVFFFFSIVNLIMSLASLDMQVSRLLSGIPGQWSFAKAGT